MSEGQSRNPVLIRGTSTQIVNGKPVTVDYAYTVVPGKLSGHELIAWANRRDAELREKRKAA